MTIEQLQKEIYRNNDRILNLQDIAFEEQIPEDEREWYVGVHWHSKVQVASAKKQIEELEAKNREFEEQINLMMAIRL